MSSWAEIKHDYASFVLIFANLFHVVRRLTNQESRLRVPSKHCDFDDRWLHYCA